MRYGKILMVVLLVLVATTLATAASAEEFKLNLKGATYTKWLWGTERTQGSLYNFTTIPYPNEAWGDNGQGSELELIVDTRVSKKVSVYARLHSRFSQNFWTNGGGWGGSNPPNTPCVDGNCGEFDSRSNQYVKLRGAAVTFNPGYKWLDTAVIGANNWNMFDPYVVGGIRYIDRDNTNGLLFSGSGKNFSYDFARISLYRLVFGPNFNTGKYHAADGAYVLQGKWTVNPMLDLTGLVDYVNDQEIDPADNNWNNGKDLRTRFRNQVFGVKFGIHPSSVFDIRGNFYYSSVDSNQLGLTGNCMGNSCEPPASLGGGAFTPVIAGKHTGQAWKLDADITDPWGIGLSFNVEAFSIGANYSSMMAARRESDVLLTEGHDATFLFGGPDNATWGRWGGNWTRIGYGGFDGNFQQVATINVDNEFTDFDEPAAETVIGWQGITIVPVYTSGALELSGELTHLTYDTNWTAWGDDSKNLQNGSYPTMELPAGVNVGYRSAYAPFQDKTTDIYLIKGKYVIDAGKGVDLFWKVKGINETDKRINDAKYLPYQAGNCPGNGQPCQGHINYFSPGNSTASGAGGYIPEPDVLTVNGVVGYRFKPFDSISDDDRDLNYYTFQLGAGYQLTNDLYASLSYEYYHAKLQDGNTAFQAYGTHVLASGTHDKNLVIVRAKLPIGGADVGFEYQYNFGTFKPDYGTGFVVQYATVDQSNNVHVPVGSPGVSGTPWGDFMSLLNQDYRQQRIKAYMKVQF
jgi:hypothetical protein